MKNQRRPGNPALAAPTDLAFARAQSLRLPTDGDRAAQTSMALGPSLGGRRRFRLLRRRHHSAWPIAAVLVGVYALPAGYLLRTSRWFGVGAVAFVDAR